MQAVIRLRSAGSTIPCSIPRRRAAPKEPEPISQRVETQQAAGSSSTLDGGLTSATPVSSSFGCPGLQRLMQLDPRRQIDACSLGICTFGWPLLLCVEQLVSQPPLRAHCLRSACCQRLASRSLSAFKALATAMWSCPVRPRPGSASGQAADSRLFLPEQRQAHDECLSVCPAGCGSTHCLILAHFKKHMSFLSSRVSSRSGLPYREMAARIGDELLIMPSNQESHQVVNVLRGMRARLRLGGLPGLALH